LTAAALHRLPAADRDKVTVVFITTDPACDTPGVIRAWLDNFTSGYPGDPTFVGLTGSQAAIQQAERQIDMPLSYPDPAVRTTSDYQVVHAGYTLIYSPAGVAHLTVDDSETLPAYVTTLEHVIDQGPA
jgi:protein SCO1/2